MLKNSLEDAYYNYYGSAGWYANPTPIPNTNEVLFGASERHIVIEYDLTSETLLTKLVDSFYAGYSKK